MKTLTEAVKACGGVWPSEASLNGVGIGWNGGTRNREPDFITLGFDGPEFTRPEFEAEARRQSYVEGFEGNPDDVAFKSYDWDGEGFPDTGDSCEAFIYADTVSGGKWVQGEVDGHARSANAGTGCLFRDTDGLLHFVGTTVHFRPLKSDRERWVEAAVEKEIMYDDCGMDEVFGRIYDALKSGELPMPE